MDYIKNKKLIIYLCIFVVIALIITGLIYFFIKQYETEFSSDVEELAVYAPEPTNAPTLEEIAEKTGESVMPKPTNVPPIEEIEEPITPEPTNAPLLEDINKQKNK